MGHNECTATESTQPNLVRSAGKSFGESAVLKLLLAKKYCVWIARALSISSLADLCGLFCL